MLTPTFPTSAASTAGPSVRRNSGGAPGLSSGTAGGSDVRPG